ncbi:MAG: hypothetical protein ACXVZ4_08785 [Gaiellaceae bacterium]
MERYRRQAKSLVRAFRAGDADAVRRAEAVLGERARQRFLLSDAQHVVAREAGHRTWPELKRAEDRAEWTVDSGLTWSDGEPVLVRVRRRGRNHDVDDLGEAARRAGRAPGWQDVAHRVVVEEWWLNVDRSGKVFVPCKRERLDWVVGRVAGASLALYLALLELEE